MFSRYTILNRLSKDYYGLKKVPRAYIDHMITIRRRRRFQDFLDHMFGWYYRPKIRHRKLKILFYNDMLHLNNTMKKTKKCNNYNTVDYFWKKKN